MDKFDNSFSEDERILINEAMERVSEKIIESCIKINQELLSSVDCFSDSYYQSFIDLKKLNIFSDDFLKSLASMAGFRNRLAHEYLDLDFDISVNTMKKIPVLFKDYLSTIVKFLDD